MIQAIIIQNTNFLIPNKEHKNFTESSELANVGAVVKGEFKNVIGLRKGKEFEYRLFFTNNGKILYANCVKAENVPSEIISSVDSSQSKTLIDLKPAVNISNAALIMSLGGGLAGYFYGKKQNATGTNLIKYIAVGTVGAYGIYYLINKNKSTINKPSK